MIKLNRCVDGLIIIMPTDCATLTITPLVTRAIIKEMKIPIKPSKLTGLIIIKAIKLAFTYVQLITKVALSDL